VTGSLTGQHTSDHAAHLVADRQNIVDCSATALRSDAQVSSSISRCSAGDWERVTVLVCKSQQRPRRVVLSQHGWNQHLNCEAGECTLNGEHAIISLSPSAVSHADAPASHCCNASSAAGVSHANCNRVTHLHSFKCNCCT
jgi:hypothetical protein